MQIAASVVAFQAFGHEKTPTRENDAWGTPLLLSLELWKWYPLTVRQEEERTKSAQVVPPTGAWRQANVTWKKPPAELKSNERYAEAAILYFSPDRRFVLLYGTVRQRPTSETISGGDGRVAFLGTWKLTGSSLHVEYRLVSRTVAKEGETLPGPVQSEDVRVRGSTLLFQKDHFRRDEKLDGDDEFKIILEHESARQRTPDGHP